MIRSIVGTSIRLRFIVITLALALMVFGILEVSKIPIDVFPEFNPPMVEVQTEALGLSAAEVEALLTVPMEADLLNGIAWLEHIYSESVPGMSSILMVFEEDADPFKVRQMVQERLTETFALPNVSLPPTMLQPLSTTSRVMMVGISSDELSLIDLGVLARWNIKPRLMGIPGVSNVSIWGKREWQVQVLVDPENLQDYGVSLNQVIATTGEALWVSPLSYLESSSPGTAGWIDTPNQRLSVRHILPISSAEEMGQIPVKGTAYRLDDIARIVEDHQPLIGDALLDNGEGLILVIEKFPNANTLEVTRDVEEALKLLSPGLSGVDMDPTVFRAADYIEEAGSNLTFFFLISVLLIILVLGVFLYEWRTTLISVFSIGVSLIFALYVLNINQATLNVMTLVGLAIGLGVIIDESIIDMQNLLNRLRDRGDEEEGENFFIDLLSQSRGSIAFTTVILAMFVLPIFFISGISGNFLKPFASAYISAILVALGVTLIISPALTFLLFSGKPNKPAESGLLKSLKKSYQNTLTRFAEAPSILITISVIILVLGVVIVPFSDVEMLPTFKKLDVLIEWEGPPGTSWNAMNRISSLALEELRAIPGVENVGALIGRAITGDKVVGINSGELMVSINPSADYDATLEAVKDVIQGYPGFFKDVGSYQPELIEQTLEIEEKDLTIRLFGFEYDALGENAELIRDAVADIDGVRGVRVEELPLKPQVEIEVDLAKAEQYQIKPGDVRRAAATLVSGLNVGNLYEEQKVFDVVVWGIPEIRQNLDDVRNLLIDTPRGGHVRLAEVAETRIMPAPMIIKRDAVSRYLDIFVDVDGRSQSAVAADLEKAIAQVNIPFEYHAEVLEDYRVQQTNMMRIIVVSIIVLIGVYLILQAAFESWRLSSITMLLWPFALSGGVIATLLAGGTYTISSIFGFFTLLAISTRAGVLIVKQIKATGPDGRDTGEFSTQIADALPTVLMTALTTGLAFLPFLFAGSIAGLELIFPMAVVIVGGMVTTLLASLFLLPVAYLKYGQPKAN